MSVGHSLIAAIALVTLALGLYTFAVWGEQIRHELRRSFILAFWAGLACDTVGTSLMALIASKTGRVDHLHSGAGIVAIVLMAVHAFWALLVAVKKDQLAEELFHRFSRYVYFLWLFAFSTGGLANLKLKG